MTLIEKLIKEEVLKSSQIIEAFQEIQRADFVPKEVKAGIGSDQGVNDYNEPLSIGFGQTISQPYTVALMLELLQPQPGDKILDIGSGSGWQTALLCYIVGSQGHVWALEVIKELKEIGQSNVEKYGFQNVDFLNQSGLTGFTKEAPFDKIIAAAAGDNIPTAWPNQLAEGGRLVCPAGDSLWLLKKEKGQIKKKEYPGFLFVPLV